MRLDLQAIGKHRLLFGYAIALACLALAREQLFLPGVAVALAGIAFRVWAAGYILKNRELATFGPYALTRNPLYLGSFLLGVGGTIAIRSWWLLAVYVAGFALFYLPTICREERDLLGLFGDDFREYQRTVPVFFPWKPGRIRGSFSFANVVRNGERRHALIYLAFLALLEIIGLLRG